MARKKVATGKCAVNHSTKAATAKTPPSKATTAHAALKREQTRQGQALARKRCRLQNQFETVRVTKPPASRSSDGAPSTGYTIYGEARSFDCLDKKLRTNLTILNEEGKPIFQRILPTSLEKKTEAIKSARIGRQLVDQYHIKQAELPPLKRTDDGKTRGSILLGISHSLGQVSLEATAQTKRSQIQDQALDLLLWAKDHTDRLLVPLWTKRVHPYFQDCAKGREAGLHWAETYLGNFVQALHRCWTTIAFFDGCTDISHNDSHDGSPSTLFNFEEACYFHLDEYKLKVRIEPLDIVVFDNTLLHRTSALSQEGKRWAMGTFFRQSILKQSPMSKLSVDNVKAALNRHAKRNGPSPSEKEKQRLSQRLSQRRK